MVFVVRLRCRNCGNEWNVLVKGDYIINETVVDSVQVYDKQNNLIGLIECPVCGIRDNIVLDERIPVHEVIGDEE